MTSTNADRHLGWIVLALVAAVVLPPAVMLGVGMAGMGPMMGGTWDHGVWGAGDGAWGWMLFVAVGVQLLFLALLVGAASLGYNALTTRSESTDPAVEELRSAYARGDLDDEAFERRRDRLESDR